MFAKIYRLLFKSYWKNNSSSFEELSPEDLYQMIDAHINGGNSNFEDNSLIEFTLMNYNNKDIERYKNYILDIENSETTDCNGLYSKNGIKRLKLLMDDLKKEQW